MEVRERCNISPTTTIHLIHEDDRQYDDPMTTSMNSDASNDLDVVRHHDGTLASLYLSWYFPSGPVFLNFIHHYLGLFIL